MEILERKIWHNLELLRIASVKANAEFKLRMVKAYAIYGKRRSRTSGCVNEIDSQNRSKVFFGNISAESFAPSFPLAFGIRTYVMKRATRADEKNAGDADEFGSKVSGECATHRLDEICLSVAMLCDDPHCKRLPFCVGKSIYSPTCSPAAFEQSARLARGPMRVEASICDSRYESSAIK